MTLTPALHAVIYPFFDSDAVIKAVSKGRRQALMRAGGYVRVTAKNGFGRPRRSKYHDLTPEQKSKWKIGCWLADRVGVPRPKLPYKPEPKDPNRRPASRSGRLKNNIFFSYDNASDDVYVGSVHFSKSKTAHLLEHGGEATLPGFDGKPMRMKYVGNPFMQPALEKSAPKIAEFFRDCVKP